jgi:hypothetical protein
MMLFSSPRQEYMDEVICHLQDEHGMELKVKQDAAEFPGFHLECNPLDGSFTLTQIGLIK